MFYVHVNRINRFEYESSKDLNSFWQNKRTRSTKYAGSYINRHSFTYTMSTYLFEFVDDSRIRTQT